MVEPGELELPQAMKVVVEDAPALLERHVTKAGLLTSVAKASPEDRFQGAQLLESTDNGVTWRAVQAYQGEGWIGHVVGTLGGDVSGYAWDTLNTLTVVMDHAAHELASEPDEEVVSGRANMLLVGREIIGFRTATLISERTYELTGLLRGRRDTRQYINAHAANERVLLLVPPSNVIFLETGFMLHKARLKYKVVPNGQTADDVPEVVDVVMETESMLPFSPEILPAHRDSAGEVTLRWIRRSRSIFRLLSCVQAPLNDCCHEEYVIDIWENDDRLVLKRTVTVEDASEYVYTVAAQTADFGAPNPSIAIDVYQVSPILGRGRVSEATV